MKALNELTVFSHRRAIRRRMDLRPLSHMQACVAVQWSDRLWSGQYRQRQTPLLRGRIRVGLANCGVDKHVSEARVRAERSEKNAPKRPQSSSAEIGKAPCASCQVQAANRATATRVGPATRSRRGTIIVRAGPPAIALLARNQRRDDGPLPVGQDPPARDRRPFSILNETKGDLGIPEMQTLPRARGLNTSDDT